MSSAKGNLFHLHDTKPYTLPEQPAPQTVAARNGRALLKRALNPKETPYLLYELSLPPLWIVVTLLAVAAFTFWLLLGACIGIALVGVRWVVRGLSLAMHAVGLYACWAYDDLRICARRTYDALRLSLVRAWVRVKLIPGVLWAIVRDLLVFLGRGILLWIVALAEACLLTDEEVAELAQGQAQGQAHPHPHPHLHQHPHPHTHVHPHPQMQAHAHEQVPVQVQVQNPEVDASDTETVVESEVGSDVSTLMESEEDDSDDGTVIGDEW